jgi:alkaline phosphatase D
MLDLAKLNDAIRHEGGVSRRLFLAYSASLAALPALSQQANAKASKPKLKKNPFALGVASGDPTESGVVLWTRLAPDPLQSDGGMAPQDVEVAWEIASDDAMRNVIRRGKSTAASKLAHSVHVEAEGLGPDRWYWYRFRAGDVESPIGRTRTMPVADATPSELKLAFASCQHYESGLYTAYQHMAEEDLDLVLHLGDYIYEGPGKEDQVRKHAGKRCETLDGYRLRHSQYRADPLLHNMHARCPWMVTWDDHDVANNYAGDRAVREMPDPAKFLIRRAAAYQAYYEMMPLRAKSIPHGPDLQLYRAQSFGQLANLMMLDGRQYRTAQPNGDKSSDINEAYLSPNGTMLGKRQHAWVENTLTDSKATWNVLANQVLMALVDVKEGPERVFPVDEWSGYIAERNQLMKFIDDRKIANTIVLTGDNHANWVNDLRTDDLRPETPLVATEFAGTSISSGGDGEQRRSREQHLKAENSGVHFHNGERGYVRCTITPKQWRTDFRTVSQITTPGAPVTTRASYVVEAGKSGAKQA